MALDCYTKITILLHHITEQKSIEFFVIKTHTLNQAYIGLLMVGKKHKIPFFEESDIEISAEIVLPKDF